MEYLDEPSKRYGNFIAHPIHPHLLVSPCQDETGATHPLEIKNYLVVINTRTSTVTSIGEGMDFYIFPNFTPDGKHIAWQQWLVPPL